MTNEDEGCQPRPAPYALRAPERPDVRMRKMKLNRPQLWWQIPTVGLILYLGAAIMVFDFTGSARPRDEEYSGQRPVAFGPLPRAPFCRGAHLDVPGGWDFDGREPIWIPFRPVCAIWRAVTGHAAPRNWR